MHIAFKWQRCTKKSLHFYEYITHSIDFNENFWLNINLFFGMSLGADSLLWTAILQIVPAAVLLCPDPKLVGQLKFRPIPGLLPWGQVIELQIQFIYICPPANFFLTNRACISGSRLCYCYNIYCFYKVLWSIMLEGGMRIFLWNRS